MNLLHENEVLMLIIGIGVLIFIVFNIGHIKNIKSWKLLLSGYFILLSAWFFTVLEGYILEKFLNIIEHLCYVFSSLIFVIWSVNVIYKYKREEDQ